MQSIIYKWFETLIQKEVTKLQKNKHAKQIKGQFSNLKDVRWSIEHHSTTMTLIPQPVLPASREFDAIIQVLPTQSTLLASFAGTASKCINHVCTIDIKGTKMVQNFLFSTLV